MINVKPGDVFYYKKMKLTVVDATSSKVFFQTGSGDDRDILSLTRQEFNEHLENGDIYKEIPALPPPEKLSEKQKEKVLLLTPYMTVMFGLYEKNYSYSTDQAYKSICIEAAAMLPPHIAPGRSTLNRHFKQYRKTGSVNALVKNDGRQRNRLDEETEAFMKATLPEVWNKTASENVYGCFQEYERLAKAENKPFASLSTFTRRVRSLGEFDKLWHNADERGRRKMLATRTSRIELVGVLHRVEIDRCDLDLCLLHENGKPTNKVSVYAAIDCYSRAIIGVTVELGTSEDTEGVVRLLSQLYMNQKELPFTGYIKEIITDNGPGFRASVINSICSGLNTSITRAPANAPYRKPFIESFFNTMGQSFMKASCQIGDTHYRGVPGYKGVLRKKSKISNGKTSEQRASMGVPAFMEIFRLFIHNYNHVWKHPSLHQTPAEQWRKGESELPSIPVDYKSVRHLFHFETKKCCLHQGGKIEINKQNYGSDELSDLYFRLKTTGMDGSPFVTVAFNPADAGAITVYAKLSDGSSIKPHIVLHKEWGKSDKIVAFDEVSNAPRIRLPLLEPRLSSSYVVKPVKPEKQTFKNKNVHSYDENRAEGLSVEEIIEKSHNKFADKNHPDKAVFDRAKRSSKNNDDEEKAKSAVSNSLVVDEEFWDE